MAKRIGILGENPLSTIDYFDYIINRYYELYKDHNYPEIVLYSQNFKKLENWIEKDEWEKVAGELKKGIKLLENAGTNLIIITANNLHLLLDELQAATSIPIISIIDATGEAALDIGLKRVGLVGTKFVMENDFYVKGLEKHGLNVILPEVSDQIFIQRIISDELSSGIISETSRNRYLEIFERLSDNGAEGIILGCTEIPHLITQEQTKIPLFDTAQIHAEKALFRSLNDENKRFE